MRVDGPLTSTSAFHFESFYAELRRAITPGTPDPLKQIFQKIILKRSLMSHSCSIPINYSHKETPLESNAYIYVFSENVHNIYKIIEIKSNSDLVCLKQGRFPLTFNEDETLPWGSVGVYRKGPKTSIKVTLKQKNVHGKVLLIDNLLITCPNDVLKEK